MPSKFLGKESAPTRVSKMGRWRDQNDQRMRFERSSPQSYDALPDGDIWKRCPLCPKKDLLGDDGLDAHLTEKHPEFVGG
jgi:hypothetical protein